MKDRELHFKNMTPAKDVESYAHSVVDDILQSAPVDSRAIALMEKTEDGYWASLDIYSKSGPYIGRAFGAEASEALNELRKDIHEKMRPKTTGFFGFLLSS